MIRAISVSGEGSGSCLQDNRAVGNSRLAHMDVLSVSCKQLPDPSSWHGPIRELGTLPHFALIHYSLALKSWTSTAPCWVALT